MTPPLKRVIMRAPGDSLRKVCDVGIVDHLPNAGIRTYRVQVSHLDPELHQRFLAETRQPKTNGKNEAGNET